MPKVPAAAVGSPRPRVRRWDAIVAIWVTDNEDSDFRAACAAAGVAHSLWFRHRLLGDPLPLRPHPVDLGAAAHAGSAISGIARIIASMGQHLMDGSIRGTRTSPGTILVNAGQSLAAIQAHLSQASPIVPQRYALAPGPKTLDHEVRVMVTAADRLRLHERVPEGETLAAWSRTRLLSAMPALGVRHGTPALDQALAAIAKRIAGIAAQGAGVREGRVSPDQVMPAILGLASVPTEIPIPQGETGRDRIQGKAGEES